jgi:hypothetical protein
VSSGRRGRPRCRCRRLAARRPHPPRGGAGACAGLVAELNPGWSTSAASSKRRSRS